MGDSGCNKKFNNFVLKIWAAEVMIYSEDFTQWTETA